MNPARFFRVFLSSILALSCLFVSFNPRVHAEKAIIFLVNTTADTHDANLANNLCLDASGNCSLRAAIEQSSTFDAVDIQLPGDQTYDIGVLLNGIDISGDGSIDISIYQFGGNAQPVITGVETGTTFTIDGAQVIMTSVIIRNSNQLIVGSNGTLGLLNVTLSGLSSPSYDGGAISTGGAVYVENGTLVVTNSNLTGNSTASGGAGGAIYSNEGDVTISGSSITDNSAGYGGGIFSVTSAEGFLHIENSTFTGNTATQYGGALLLNGYNQQGGGSSQVHVYNSRIYANQAPNGGGIFIGKTGDTTIEPFSRGGVNIKNSEIAENSATTGSGGGIYLKNLDNPGGSFYVYLENSTISSNLAFNRGGGIYIAQDGGNAVYGYNVTITNNAADSGGSNGSNGGGYFNETSSELHLNNSILAGNRDLTGGMLPIKIPDCVGKLVVSYSLVGLYQSVQCTFVGDTSTSLYSTAGTGINPGLDVLSDHGLDTRSHIPFVYSPVNDRGNPAGCTGIGGTLLTTDQHYATRPRGQACELGSVEIDFARVFLPALMR